MGTQAVVRKKQGMKWKNDGLNFVPTVQSTYEAHLADGLTRQVIIRQCNFPFSPIILGDVCKPGPVPDANSMLKVNINTNSEISNVDAILEVSMVFLACMLFH